MNVLPTLARAVSAGLASQAIGRPVAVRAFLSLSADHGHLPQMLAELIATAADWFDSSPQTLHAQRGPGGGQLVLMVEHAGGQTIMLTAVTPFGEEPPTADVLVVGNQGTLAWEGPGNDRPTTEAYQPVDETPIARSIRNAIDESLRTADAVSIAGGD